MKRNYQTNHYTNKRHVLQCMKFFLSYLFIFPRYLLNLIMQYIGKDIKYNKVLYAVTNVFLATFCKILNCFIHQITGYFSMIH